MKKTLITALIICMVLPVILSACAKPHDHTYTSEITKQPTCKATGQKTFTCSICGKTYTEEIAVTDEHEYTEEVTTEPTCTKDGEKTFTCSICGASHTEKVPAAGHSWKEKVTKKATCTKDGKKTLTCTVCGKKKTEKIQKLGHSYQEKTVKKATYISKGKIEKKCSRCGKSSTKTTPKLTSIEYIKGKWTETSYIINTDTITSLLPTRFTIYFSDNEIYTFASGKKAYSCAIESNISTYNGTNYYWFADYGIDFLNLGDGETVNYAITTTPNQVYAIEVSINPKTEEMRMAFYDSHYNLKYATIILKRG